jgi:phage terminase large subunit-like protein
VLRAGLDARGAQMVAISTAGERESSPLGQMRQAAYRLPDQKRNGAHRRAANRDGTYVMHEWALDPGQDVDDMRVVKTCNPAPWHTLVSLRRRHDSPSTTPWAWQRFACGLWVSSQSWWLDPEQWTASETSDRLQPGDRVTLGFDGARTGDATALVACRLEDGLLEPLGVWEDPGDRRGWEVPAGEVDAAIADAMERFRVARGYFDPPLWQTEIDTWAADYGGTAVMRFHTRRTRMIDAVERFRTDVAAGRVPHTGHPALTRHALNAQTREVRGGYWLAKPGAGVDDKIDTAVAAVLAWEARADELTSNQAPGQLFTF